MQFNEQDELMHARTLTKTGTHDKELELSGKHHIKRMKTM